MGPVSSFSAAVSWQISLFSCAKQKPVWVSLASKPCSGPLWKARDKGSSDSHLTGLHPAPLCSQPLRGVVAQQVVGLSLNNLWPSEATLKKNKPLPTQYPSDQVAMLLFPPLAFQRVNVVCSLLCFWQVSFSLLQTTGSETLALGIPPANAAPADLPGPRGAEPGADKEIETTSRSREMQSKFCKSKKNQKLSH